MSKSESGVQMAGSVMKNWFQLRVRLAVSKLSIRSLVSLHIFSWLRKQIQFPKWCVSVDRWVVGQGWGNG
jgi:hypothetical protein